MSQDLYYKQMLEWSKQQAAQQAQRQGQVNIQHINEERERLRRDHLERTRIYEAQLANASAAAGAGSGGTNKTISKVQTTTTTTTSTTTTTVGPSAQYKVTYQIGLLNANPIASLSGIQFTPSASNITVPSEALIQQEYTVYTGIGSIVNNLPITLTINKGLLDTPNNIGAVYYNKNGTRLGEQEFQQGAASYTFNVTAALNDLVEFYISTYND